MLIKSQTFEGKAISTKCAAICPQPKVSLLGRRPINSVHNPVPSRAPIITVHSTSVPTAPASPSVPTSPISFTAPTSHPPPNEGKSYQATLLLQCPDRQGVIAAVTQLLYGFGCNIITSDQCKDFGYNTFFQRIAFDYSELVVGPGNVVLLERAIAELAQRFKMTWRISYRERLKRLAVLVSKEPHCLYDILIRHQSGELQCEIPIVISNHADLAPVAAAFGIPFKHIPIVKKDTTIATTTATTSSSSSSCNSNKNGNKNGNKNDDKNNSNIITNANNKNPSVDDSLRMADNTTGGAILAPSSSSSSSPSSPSTSPSTAPSPPTPPSSSTPLHASHPHIPKPSDEAVAAKLTQESEIEAVLKDLNIDTLVLARYMQVLSPDFCRRHWEHTINIHHSFLPAFEGARPYHRAHARGVKIIGATAHFATPELDAGPIIDQGVARISHRDSVEDMIRKGRDLERMVLANALRWHLGNRILVHNNKTIVFAD